MSPISSRVGDGGFINCFFFSVSIIKKVLSGWILPLNQFKIENCNRKNLCAPLEHSTCEFTLLNKDKKPETEDWFLLGVEVKQSK